MVAMSDAENKAQSGASPNSQKSPQKVESTPVDAKAEAYAALGAGKRHLLVSDVPSAVSSLGLACELLSSEFGETATECAEAYFYYGKALLELARIESGVFGNAMDGVPEGEDVENSQVEDPENLTEEEKNNVEDKVDEALDENFDACEKKKAETNGVHEKDGESEKSEEASTEDGTGGDLSEEETEAEPDKETDSVGSTEDAKTEKEDEDKSAQEMEDEEDPSNLQLAWEMLELAKVVFSRQLAASSSPESKTDLEKKLCETFLVLGEVSLENEHYSQAEDDLTNCLKMRQGSLPADSRSIAETHYQLGIAQGFHMKYEEAIESLNAAISVLEMRIKNLKNESESPDEANKNDAFHTREREVAELEALIPEIKEKIADTKEMKEENLRKMRESVGFSSGSGEGSSSNADPKPISSIAIKRKTTDEEGDPKKPKA